MSEQLEMFATKPGKAEPTPLQMRCAERKWVAWCMQPVKEAYGSPERHARWWEKIAEWRATRMDYAE